MKAITKIALATVAVAAMSSGAMAADLAMPKAAPVAAPAATSWDGAYLGANIGYGWGFADHTDISPGNDINLDGLLVGGQVGYNFHLSDNIVAGVEGSIDWANQTGTNDGTGPTPAGEISHTINWDGTVVGKLGLDMGQWMPYIDGGLAFANSTRDATGAGGVAVSSTDLGWTAGVGVEAMLADNLSGFVSYNYADYGSHTWATGGITPTVHLTDSIVKAGLNWHF